jgi:hypothetical protein
MDKLARRLYVIAQHLERCAAPSLKDDVEKFMKLLSSKSDFGAYDTEPRGFFTELMRKAAQQQKPFALAEYYGWL